MLPDLHSSGCAPNPAVIGVYEASCSECSPGFAQVPMDVTNGHYACSSWQEGLSGLRLQEPYKLAQGLVTPTQGEAANDCML